jgi:hypothetical protein
MVPALCPHISRMSAIIAALAISIVVDLVRV